MKNNLNDSAKLFWQILKLCFVTLIVVAGMQMHANAATQNAKIVGKFSAADGVALLKLAAVDLPQILPFIMGPNDVFQGYVNVVYKGRQALKLRIFNQQSGRVRYVYVDAQSGQIL